MKRLLLSLVLVLSILGMTLAPAAAADAPVGTWLGTWPYAAPGTHNLNSFAAGGLNDNLGLVYRPLVELTPAYYLWATNEYVGILADSWGFVDDNAAFEYTIKSDALWSNGDQVTSEDVVNTFAIGRILGWSQWGYLANVEAASQDTVRFTFQEGRASRNAERQILKEHVVASANYGELAAQAMQLVADGKTKDDAEWTALATAIAEFRPETLIASGPYTYALDDVGEAFMTLSWQPLSLYSASVKFGELKLWAGETEATTALVLSGELAHSTNVYPPATIDSFVAEGIRLVTTPRGYGPALLFNFNLPAFQDARVRQAMAHAINREQSALLTNGLGASGTVTMSGILDSIAPTILSQETLDSLNGYEYNLEGAAALMQEAGYTLNADGKWANAAGEMLSIEYTFPADFADFSAAARDATAQLNEFGFDISERALPWQEAAEAIRLGDFDLSVWSWGAGSPFAFQNMNNPIRRWNNPVLPAEKPGMSLPLQFEMDGTAVDMDALILDVSNGLDTDALQAKADTLAQIINAGMYYIPLNEMLSVEPVNELAIAGAPADGDPIYANPSNDHFIVKLILDGTLGPVS
ncbi:MAG: ABC transporter substrate-binding protein [Chloroflexota bacterium]|nr:ABC transporter substrate-binding protein [Chloroflexota bacterium]